MYPFILTKRRLGKNFIATTYTLVTVEQLLGSFSAWSMLYQRTIGD
jgi:hypothetical protein